MARAAKSARKANTRANRTVRVGDVVGKTLDPAFKKRGFASRDLVAHWAAIAPAPYDRVTMPDRLSWPRRKGASAQAGTLYLRCRPEHALALDHEGQRIAQAVNRYFGYFLVASVKLSAEPFVIETRQDAPPVAPDPQRDARIAADLEGVENAELRDALAKLGRGVLSRR